MKKKLEPLQATHITKGEASYQALLLDMMNKLLIQQRQTNQILMKSYSIEQGSRSPKKNYVENISENQSEAQKMNQSPQRQLKHDSSISRFQKNITEEQRSPKKYEDYQNFNNFAAFDKVFERLQQKMQKYVSVGQKIYENIQKMNISRQAKSNQLQLNKISQNQILNRNFQKLFSGAGKHFTASDSLKSIEQKQILQKALTTQISQDKRKNYNLLSQIQPYSDRRQIKIKISLGEYLNEIPIIKGAEDLQRITTQWTGDVYRTTASICWNMLLNGFLTFEQTKILFTENIIYNYLEYMKDIQKHHFSNLKHRITTLINQISVPVLQFLTKQYPQTKVDIPNIALRQIIPQINNSNRAKFDVIAIAGKKGVHFQYKQTGNYTNQIMKMLNFIIQQTNLEFDDFQKKAHQVFDEIFIPINKRKLQNYEETAQDTHYRQKIKRYTKYLIGRKVSKNISKYSAQQIENGVFFVKSPSLLRIITKWVQQLTDIIKDPESQILSSEKQFKNHQGGMIFIYSPVRKALHKKILQKRKQVFDRIQTIKSECYLIQSILSSPLYTTDNMQAHLSQDQISVGKFSVYLQQAISSYIFSELNFLIHFLLSVPLQVDQKNIGITEEYFQSQTRKDLDKLNLITMKVFDLLRCKCHSNQQQIVWIMNRLIQKNELHGDFKIVRVKDRLGQGTRDILLNLRFKKGGLISQMQLSVVSNVQKKQELLDNYNHFLYELKRSKLGPLSENVSIWSVLQQRSSYFNINRKFPIPDKPNLHKCSNQFVQKFTRPTSCQSCKNFYPRPKTCLLNIQCTKCKMTYCGQCFYKGLSDIQQKKYIFQKLLKQNQLENIIQYDDYSKQFPLQGLFIKRNFLNKQVAFYTIFPKKETNSQNQFQQDRQKCQLIFCQTVIRDDQVIHRQQKTGQFVGDIKGGKVFLTQKSRKLLNNFIIYSFSNKFQRKIMTLDEIETFLSKQQNFKVKVLNILEQPAYISELTYLRKKTQKTRELFRLRKIINDQKILILTLKSTFVLAQVYKPSAQLRSQITLKQNLSKIKSFGYMEKNIISMEHASITSQFNDLSDKVKPIVMIRLKSSLRKLYLNYNNITSVQGLNAFQLLEVLYLRHNKITSLEGLEKLVQLIVLRIDDNQIESIQPLKNLKKLRRVMGNDNNIKSLDPLKDIPDLKTIDFMKNKIQNIDSLTSLKLESLDLKKNPLIRLFKFSTCQDTLIDLNISDTLITDLSPIILLKKLKILSIQGLKLDRIPQFIKNFKFTELWMANNEIQKIQNLDGQQELKILSLKHNKIKILENVDRLFKIQTLYLDFNQITSLDGVKPLVDTLVYLSLKNNPLDDCKYLQYTDQDMKFQYTPQTITTKAKTQIVQIMFAKAAMSDSDG